MTPERCRFLWMSLAAALLLGCPPSLSEPPLPLASTSAPEPSASMVSSAPVSSASAQELSRELTWETFPFGRPFGTDVIRPSVEQAPQRLCSFERPLCIHAAGAFPPERALAVLTMAEHAYDRLRWASLLPAPHPDGVEGGSSALDLYLVSSEGALFRFGVEIPERALFDRAPAFARIDPSLTGCALETTVTRAVATALLAALAPQSPGGWFAASSTYYAAGLTGCWPMALDGLDRAQAHPERAVLDSSSIDAPQASPLLPWYMDAAYGASTFGSLLTGLWNNARNSSPLGASRYHDDRDPFFVLAGLAKVNGSSFGDLMLDLSIARAFWGSRSDEVHVPDAGIAGSFGRVLLDASYSSSSLPRTLQSKPIEATGAVYLWIDTRDTGAADTLAARFEWEHPVTFRWAFVRVDGGGRELSRVLVTPQRGVFIAEKTLVDLPKDGGVLLVGVNLGNPNPDTVVRADELPNFPHAALITVYRQKN